MLRNRSLALLIVALSSCAGGSLSKIEKGGGELPKELAADVKEKFEVRELPATAPSPNVSPIAAVSSVSNDATKTQGKATALPLAPVSPKALKTKSKRKKKGDRAASLASSPVFSYPIRRPPKEPIWIGEKLTYQVTYLGLPAGTFTLEALPHKTIDNRKVYHVMAKAWNSAVFGLVYKLDDYVESFIDFDGFFSHRFHLHQDESKQVRDSLELYDSEKKQSYWWNRWDRKERGYSENKDFYPMDPFPQDTLSSLYYLRSVPLPPKAVVDFPVMSEGKPLTAYVTVIGREELDTFVGPLKTIKIKPEAATRGVLERRGDSYMWLTDDDRRFLVRIEAKVKIGSVIAELKKIELGTPPAP